jgi:hypothetical protein
MNDWKSLLDRMTIDDECGSLKPATLKNLKQIEQRLGITLPKSYLDYCTTFGPGDIDGCYRISVPGFTKRGFDSYDLEKLNKHMHDNEYDVYFPGPNQYQRSIVFANTARRDTLFWDPQDVTDADRSEYGIWVLQEDFVIRRVCDTFWELINEICLGSRHGELGMEPPEFVFCPC